MFGITVDLIFKDWKYIGTIRCKGIPRRGELIYIADFQKYVGVVNVIHETGFWSGKTTVIVETITDTEGQKLENNLHKPN
jgi:hypothetical protein